MNERGKIREQDAQTGDVRQRVQDLVSYCIGCGLLKEADRIWAYNTVLDCVGTSGPTPDEAWALGKDVRQADGQPKQRHASNFDLEAALLELGDVAAANNTCEDTASGRDRIAMRVMGALMPRPSEVAETFSTVYDAQGARAATDSFYQLCCDCGYVRRAAIARNLQWVTPTRWGKLEITVNLSKPEKDPRDIAAAGRTKSSPTTAEKYPACQLCIENEGYPGRSAQAAGGAHPARQNLRIVPIELGGHRWGLQYSPYAYFNEHCIAMNAQHRPMHIDREALDCLFDFVDLFPHYFIGSNADLPIVGGSILSHDHFQGGRHAFPMMQAASAEQFSLPSYPRVRGDVLRWPLSVLRLSSQGLTRNDRTQILEAAMHIIDTWRVWSDESVGIVARDADGTPHNTVTPIVRRLKPASDGKTFMDGSAGTYEVYLALRCNVTSGEHSLGVFHPHEQWHHIKKENIGLIEVMGLAILPPRLKPEMAGVQDHLLTGDLDKLESDPLTRPHATWARDVYIRRKEELTPERCDDVLREEIGIVFSHVLEDAGVFKWDEKGRSAQARFIAAL